ncbi:MAG: acetamidase/formamidase family protein [Caulobacteraceae bacterium]
MPNTCWGLAAIALLAGTTPAWAEPHSYTLEPTPKTIVWGHFDGTEPPALRIQSGDTVTFHTLLTNSPDGLEAAGAPAKDVEPALRQIFREVTTDKGPGSHILTGPVYIEGAEPGDTLEVRIRRIDLAIPYAYNMFAPGMGFQVDAYPYKKVRIIPLDKTTHTAHFAPGVEVPLHPFFGDMGVAPPASMGRISSGPPTIIGGNMDNKELVEGTSVFFPVYAPGAMFQIGDGHAGQGNGEVDVTALETSLVGTMQFILHKGVKTGPYPRAETPTHYISMGFDDDLSAAAHKAVAGMIDFLVTQKHMSRDDAYMLISVAGDIDITELVDSNKGVHVMLPKAVFVEGK